MAKRIPIRFKSPSDGRDLALQALYKSDTAASYSTLSLSSLLEKSKLDSREKNLATALFYGTLSQQVGLDFCLSPYSKRSFSELDPLLKSALRLAAYQLYFSPHVPKQAVVDTTVELVKKYSHSGLSGYANAVLRGMLRNLPEFPTQGPAAAGLVPELYEEIYAFLKAEPLLADEKMIEGYFNTINQIRPLTLRLRTNQRSETEILQSLTSEGVTWKACTWPAQCYEISLGHKSLKELSAWQTGELIVQGRAAQLPAILAAHIKPKRVLDLCAAPGGKCLQLYDLLDGKVDILANDLHAERIRKIEENRARLKISDLKTQVRDASVPLSKREQNKFDLVLADVPCSSLGLVDRKPELRLNAGHCDDSLLKTQAAILDTAASALKVGGVLIYSTCTLNPQENQEQVKAFLVRQKAKFKAKDLESLPRGLSETTFTKHQLIDTPAMLNLYPQIHGTEGFFIAQLERIH